MPGLPARARLLLLVVAFSTFLLAFRDPLSNNGLPAPRTSNDASGSDVPHLPSPDSTAPRPPLVVSNLPVRFADVVPAAFAQRGGPIDLADISFELELDPSSLALSAVAKDSGAPVPTLSIAARLLGPNEEHFGCHFEFDGTLYRCPSASGLGKGIRDVEAVVVRQPRPGVEEERCLPGKLAGEKGPISLVDYIVGMDPVYFSDLEACLAYPYKLAAKGKWNKGEAIPTRRPPEEVSCNETSSQDLFGALVPVSQKSAFLKGNEGLDSSILEDSGNIQRGARHVFAPNTCRYRIFNRTEATKCLSSRRVNFLGDSRMRQIWQHARNWTGKNFGGHVIIDRLGLATVADETKGFKWTVPDLLFRGQTVVLNSLLHDVADYANDTSVSSIRKLSEPEFCPQCEDGKVLLDCPECSYKKRRTIQKFLLNLNKLASQLSAGGISRSRGSRLFWVQIDNQPPLLNKNIWTWQSHDVLTALLDKAYEVLRPYATEVDLRPMIVSSPNKWWAGPHFKAHEKDLMAHMALQIIMNAVC